MKFFLKIAIYIFLFAFSFNLHALDWNSYKVSSTDLNSICNENNGSLDTNFNIESFSQTVPFVEGFKFALWKSWYKTNKSVNDSNVPYLIDSANTETSSLLVESYEIIDNSIKLNIKSFNCSCPNGKNTYGLCKPETPSLLSLGENLTHLQICSQNGAVANVTVVDSNESTHKFYKRYESNPFNAYQGSWDFDSTNASNLFSLVRGDWADTTPQNNRGYTFLTAWNYSTYAGGTGTISKKTGNCICPTGSTKNSYGQCEPINCHNPEMEISSGVCGTPDICPDGGPSQNGSCDRSCESIGLLTDTVNINDWDYEYPSNNKMCVDGYDCNTDGKVINACIEKCGSRENIKNFTCTNDPVSYTACECKDDDIDDIVDEETPDETTQAGDSLLSNKYLKQIKDEMLSQSEMLNEYEGLLTANNESNLRQEDKLTSMDGKLSNIDNSINNLNDGINNIDNSINNLNNGINDLNDGVDSLNDGQDLTNGWLEDIYNKLVDIYTFYTDLEEEVLNGANNAQNQLDNELEELETTEDLDIVDKINDKLDEAVSKYQNSLGFSTSYGSKPQNITVTLFNKDYIMLNFSVLDEHISAIRALFLSLAYLSGFLLLLKKD